MIVEVAVAHREPVAAVAGWMRRYRRGHLKGIALAPATQVVSATAPDQSPWCAKVCTRVQVSPARGSSS
jgi:hypothetical protein